ncbi:hypothetical protein F4859DRAFT_341856 [Xylaria cf. heliscus]|nr:hypothetical protein F4859DRAFT_341856 [Xylaria cf. heliscus]
MIVPRVSIYQLGICLLTPVRQATHIMHQDIQLLGPGVMVWMSISNISTTDHLGILKSPSARAWRGEQPASTRCSCGCHMPKHTEVSRIELVISNLDLLGYLV